MNHKSAAQIQANIMAVQQQLHTLKGRQTRYTLLDQFSNRDVTRSRNAWFVNASGNLAQA